MYFKPRYTKQGYKLDGEETECVRCTECDGACECIRWAGTSNHTHILEIMRDCEKNEETPRHCPTCKGYGTVKCIEARKQDEYTRSFLNEISDDHDTHMIKCYEEALRILGGNLERDNEKERKLAKLVHANLTNEVFITNLAQTRFKPETIDILKEIRNKYARD